MLVALTAVMDAAPKARTWQTGQLTSMKAEGTDRGKEWTSYIYTVQVKEHTYSAVLPAPLKASVHGTVKFAVEKDLIYIQDADGKVKKACLLEPGEPATTPGHP